MLDIVRHHREHGGDKVHSEIPVAKRCKGDFFSTAYGCLLTEWVRC
jgi:hypothetical protein